MAFDEKLAGRIRELLKGRRGLDEKKMFGGLAILVKGHMACGVLKKDLVVRVPPDEYPKIVKQTNVRPMTFTGKPMKGMVYVGPKGTATKASLRKWVDGAVEFARTLPPKKKKK